VNQELNSF